MCQFSDYYACFSLVDTNSVVLFCLLCKDCSAPFQKKAALPIGSNNESSLCH